jgi:hypothetical protein
VYRNGDIVKIRVAVDGKHLEFQENHPEDHAVGADASSGSLVEEGKD